ncbi:Ankyrin repeat A protein 2 [Tyrophagus putrescentiae]|nr:Ankyrin repeat A protein 2 [Tyrophagus putrescentiae]
MNPGATTNSTSTPGTPGTSGNTANTSSTPHGLQASQGSAFSPYRPSTVLTNLQRGNVQTPLETGEPRTREVHELAALGELFPGHVNLAEIDVNQSDGHGLTPVHWAATYGQLESLNRLREQGASWGARGPEDETALMLAASGGHNHVVKALIAHLGAGIIDDVDEDGNSALMFAAYGGHKAVVKELLEHGADVTLVNCNLDTAYDIATKLKRTEIQSMLQRHILNLIS